ncbi:transcription factor IIIB 50 kDa subunit [Trichomycterus rosablanca]|uniref:transcription factor IIIB 50 kDa subunit n=1 Tax=Trichomycterus rosablanca TaxID=2290929 RepID=UPI002F3529FA
MPPSCPQCGSGNVVEDELYSQTQWVCQDCGSVVSEGILTTTLSDEQHSTAVPYHTSTEVTKRLCPNLIKGLSQVRSLCRILRLSCVMESAAVSLFERAYGHAHFLHVRLVKKEVLGGCCVLAVCRQNDCPIAMGTIGSLLYVDSAFMGVVYQDLIKVLNIQPTSTSITQLLESHCHGYNLSSGAVPDVCVESVQSLVQRSAALLELAADTWLVTGRHPLPLLTACVYVAWQSLKPTVRMKYTLNTFCALSSSCKQSGSGKRPAAARRVAELRQVLCELGGRLPWLRGGAVEPGSVATLVDDIIKHRRALMLQAMRSHESQEEEEQEEGGAAEQSAPSTGEQHWAKRHLFLPPSARNPKRRRTEAPGPEVTGDEEISDSEVESYIRSPEEVKLYQEAQRRLEEVKE